MSDPICSLCGRPIPPGSGTKHHLVPKLKGGKRSETVLLHAICDALLGAAALGDIGRHFPDTDPAYAGASSRRLLARVAELLHAAGWRVVNIDATVIAERPKIAPHVEAMRAHVAADTGLVVGAVNIKGTTTEKMGFTGRGEGIAATAVCLLEPLR